MNLTEQQTQQLGTFSLLILMALTRSDHFGSAVSLPDASLAVFYLAGIFSGGLISFALLLISAGLLDYIAITHWQVSDYCISPAYVFLIPTYAVMFGAGRFSVKYSQLNIRDISFQVTSLLIATSIAFFISNGGFYWFSGKFPELSIIQYSERVAQYYPAYLSSTLFYSLTIMLFCKLVYMAYQDKYKLA